MLGTSYLGGVYLGGLTVAAVLAGSASESVAVSDSALCTVGRARTASDTVLIGGQNRCWNPGVENNTNSWGWFTYVGGSVVNSAGRITSDAFRGAACLEVNFTAGSSPQVEANCVLEPTDLLAPGTVVCCRIAVKITGPLNANTQIQGMLRGSKASDGSFLFETQYGGKGALGIVKPPVSGQWYEMYGTVTVPTNTGGLSVSCFVANLTNGQTYTLRVDGGFGCITPSVDTFFAYNDGSSTGWRWVGAAGNSPSRSLVPDLAAGAPINLPRAGTDSTSLSDSAAAILASGRSATDVSALSESAARDTDTFARTTADAATQGDGASRVAGFARAASDTAAASEAASGTGVSGRTAGDTASVSDSTLRDAVFVRVLADSVAVLDAASRLLAASLAASDSVADADSASRALGKTRTASDSLAVVDSSQRFIVLSRTLLYDSVPTADFADRLVGLQRRLGEDAIDVDDASVVRNFVRHGFDNLTTSDSARRLLTAWKASNDTVGVIEAARRRLALLGLASDSTPVADAVTAVLVGLVRNGHDRVAIFDAAAAWMHLLPRVPVMVASNATPSDPLAASARLAEPMVTGAVEAIVLTGGLVVVEGT